MNDPALLFFAALAAFLCYRLYTVLGTRGGHEPEEGDAPTPLRPRPVPEDSPPPNVVTAAPLPPWAETVREAYPEFDVPTFVEGAKSAYEMIVQGFAAGAMDDINAYLEADVRSAFATAVEARQQADQSMEVTFVGIERADVVQSTVENGMVRVMVAFQSDQIRVVRDGEGNVIDGDPNRIDLVKDVWTFARPVGARDPNWTLAATDGAAPTQG